jgi:hypothetical protein
MMPPRGAANNPVKNNPVKNGQVLPKIVQLCRRAK